MMTKTNKIKPNKTNRHNGGFLFGRVATNENTSLQAIFHHSASPPPSVPLVRVVVGSLIGKKSPCKYAFSYNVNTPNFVMVNFCWACYNEMSENIERG